MTNQELESRIYSAARGDREALRQIYEGCGHSVYSYALSILHSRQAAEDITQETFLRIWKSAGSYRGALRPMAWIMSIAHNAAVDFIRRQSREETLNEDTAADDAPERSAEHRCDIEKALLSLPEDERRIVVLKVISGLRYSDICAILGIPAGTAAWKYSRGIKKLRAILSQD